MADSKQHQEPHLQRNLKNRHVQLIAIGGTIGTGLFLGSGTAIQMAGPAILLAYLIAGLACFLLMRALGELLLSDLHQTSFLGLIGRYLGKSTEFVTGWVYWFCWIALAMSEVTAIGVYFKFWFPDMPQWLPGLIVLVILLGMNLINVGLFGETEFWFALIKIVAIVGLIVIGLFLVFTNYGHGSTHASFANLINYGGFFPKGASGFVMAFQMVVFSFVGIEMVGLTASETKDPEEILPRAIDSIPMRIILFYLGALLVMMAIFPWNQVATNGSPFVQVFQKIGIPYAGDIINFVVITAAASACNSSLFSTGRMLFTLTHDSKNKQLHKLGQLSKHYVPRNGLLFSTVIVAVAVLLNMVIPGRVFTLVASVATVSFLYVWSMIILAHIKYKKKPEAQRATFKLPFAPFTDWLFLAFMLFVTVILVLNTDTLVALLFAVVLITSLYGLQALVSRRESR